MLVWLLGSARVEPGGGGVEAAHGEALEGLLERLVDSPVRGLVYEAGGSVPAALRDRGAGVARAAESRWQLPVAICEVAPDDPAGQVAALEAEVLGLL